MQSEEKEKLHALALFAEAEQLIGRPIEIDQTRDGKFIALWMSFGRQPPPKGDSPGEALEKFVTWYKENHHGKLHDGGDAPIAPDTKTN